MKYQQYFRVDTRYLIDHPNCIYVYDGSYGRKLPTGISRFVLKQVYPFITHILPKSSFCTNGLFFTPEAYIDLIYPIEEALLVKKINENPDKTFLIDPLGFFVNRSAWDVYSTVIQKYLYTKLKNYKNVVLLWKGLTNIRRKKCQENKSSVTKQEQC